MKHGPNILTDMDVDWSIDFYTKLNRYIVVRGWIHCPDRVLAKLYLRDMMGNVIEASKINMYYPSAQVAPDIGFEIDYLFDEVFIPGFSMKAVFEDGSTFFLTSGEAEQRFLKRNPANHLINKFMSMIEPDEFKTVLDIGSRARSGRNYRRYFPAKKYIGLDIMEGENVDIVGDAHNLSKYVPSGSIDVIYSNKVFEHLFMPWKVALEMNKVMRPGALALIQTHQMLGMHDMPWDFWRFSGDAWSALFNEKTGFRIVDKVLAYEMVPIPFYYLDQWKDVESSAGFAESAVLVERTGGSHLSWDVQLDDVISNFYPE
ncbi:hypothetical protein GGE65_005135 [Skermanella aerolata]|uniref:methyltransferase domain-containing protein n=1 Tax=Skermanella aerolata TaxID=393310 RepID=UPI003D2074E5